MVAVSAELLKVFGFWGSVLVLKMLAMVPLTARQRFRKKVYISVAFRWRAYLHHLDRKWTSIMHLIALIALHVVFIFANEDDAKMTGGKVILNDPDVERVRRSHLNDLENVVPWFIITYLWLTTGPSYWMAKTLIQTFVLSRIVHTFSYAICPQQPMRAIAFFVGFGTMGYEALSTLLYYC